MRVAEFQLRQDGSVGGWKHKYVHVIHGYSTLTTTLSVAVRS